MIRQTMRDRAVLRRVRGAEEGFTLIELMIVVAIIAVLTVVAFGSYNWATTKTRRKEAESCVEQGAQYMERFYATNLKYTGAVAATMSSACPADLNNYYTLAFSGTPDGTTYTITGTPKGTQLARDTTCKTLAMDQTGRKMYNTSTVDTNGTCW